MFIKTMASFFYITDILKKKKPSMLILSKHLQYKYTQNSRTINKTTINLFFCTFDTIDIEKFHLQYGMCSKLELYIWNYKIHCTA